MRDFAEAFIAAVLLTGMVIWTVKILMELTYG
jgi:hypothetical protein